MEKQILIIEFEETTPKQQKAIEEIEKIANDLKFKIGYAELE